MLAGNRLLIVAKHPSRQGLKPEPVTVQAMAVVPRGCFDQHR